MHFANCLIPETVFYKAFFAGSVIEYPSLYIAKELLTSTSKKKKMISKLAEKSLIPPSVFSEFLSMHPNNTQESNHSSSANGFSSKISELHILLL